MRIWALAPNLIAVEDFMILDLDSIAMLHGIGKHRNTIWEGNDSLRWWNYSSIKCSTINFKNIHFTRTNKLYMRDLTERTQKVICTHFLYILLACILYP